MEQATYNPVTLASREFAKEFPVLYDAFINLRINGVPADLAVIQAFEMIPNGLSLENVDILGRACDVNPYVIEGVQRALEASDIKRDLWPKHRAARALLCLIEDPRERGATRLNAINALSALCGYDDLDDAMRRRASQTLRDFEGLNADWQSGSTAH